MVSGNETNVAAYFFIVEIDFKNQSRAVKIEIMIIHNVRSWRILYYLIYCKHTATADQLATYLDVSVRTVKNDMKDVKILAHDSGCELISQKARGYTIEVKDQTIYDSMKDLLFMNFSDGEYISNQDGTAYQIMRHLLLAHGWITEDAIADSLFISLGTVKSCMSEVKQFLAAFNLKLESKPAYGLQVVGSEINIRFCLLELLIKHHHEAIFLFDYPEYERLFDFTNLRLKDVRHLFMDKLRDSGLHLVDAHTHRFVRYIALMYNRSRQGYRIELDDSIHAALKDLRETQFVADVVNANHEVFGLPMLDDDEIAAMAILLLYWSDVDYSCDIKSTYGNAIDKMVNDLSNQCLSLIDSLWAVDLTPLPLVKPLLNSLFVSTAYRYRFKSIAYDMTIDRNVVRNDIMVSALAVSMANQVLGIIDALYELQSNSFFIYELGARLTVLFQTIAIPYTKRRVVIAMRHGLDSGLITKNWLIDHYGYDKFERIDIKNFYEIRGIDWNDYDMALVNSDRYYYHYDLPAIMCRTFPTQEQADAIHDRLIQAGYPLESIITSDDYPDGLIIRNVEFNDRKETLQSLCYRFVGFDQDHPFSGLLDTLDDAFVYHDTLLVIVPANMIDTKVFEVMHLSKTLRWYSAKVNHILMVSVDLNHDLVKMRVLAWMIRIIVMDHQIIHDLTNDKTFTQLFTLIHHHG